MMLTDNQINSCVIHFVKRKKCRYHHENRKKMKKIANDHKSQKKIIIRKKEKKSYPRKRKRKLHNIPKTTVKKDKHKTKPEANKHKLPFATKAPDYVFAKCEQAQRLAGDVASEQFSFLCSPSGRSDAAAAPISIRYWKTSEVVIGQLSGA